ncbi:MAG: dihydroorotase family protein [Candidatus Hodarchaeota archaeon]
MLVDTVLCNTKIYIQGGIVEAGLAIEEGRIVKIAKKTNLPPASTKINLKGDIALPGLIDSHVHLRDQQLAYKEDFLTGTAAAAAGGITLAVDMPNNKPVTFSSSSLRERMKLAEKRVLTNVAFYSAFPKRLEKIAEVVKAGAVGFKVYLSRKIGGIDIDDDEVLLAAFREATANGVPVAVHAEERKILEERKRELEAAGRSDVWAYVRAHPVEAEVQAIRRIVKLIKKSGVRVHFCHVSSALGIKAIIGAKKEGLPVTCEVTPHHLFLSSEEYKRSKSFAITDPPLRTDEDVSVLWSALKGGFIDMVASDHAPHALDEKDVESVWEAKPGIPGLETTLPLLLTQVNKSHLSLAELVRLTATAPANIFHFSNRGSLESGNRADIVVVDMKKEYKIASSVFFSKAKYSPFDGVQVRGKPVKTFVNGRLVMDGGEIVAEFGSGEVIGSRRGQFENGVYM